MFMLAMSTDHQAQERCPKKKELRLPPRHTTADFELDANAPVDNAFVSELDHYWWSTTNDCLTASARFILT